MSHAVIGMFATAAAANAAREQLIKGGVSAGMIKMTPSGTATASTTTTSAAYEDKGFWSSVKEMFTGEDDVDQHVGHYAEGARRGNYLVQVEATDANAEKVADILDDAGAVNVDEKAQEWRKTGYAPKSVAATTTTATTGAATTGAATMATAGTGTRKIDIVKENLSVDKQVVSRGGVRIVKRVIARPVEKDVTLREEHVKVDRHVVDRPLTGAAIDAAFKGDTIELTESAEQAVLNKTARVVGEVDVGKTVEEHKQTIRDTVRETDVQVEQLPGQTTTSTVKTTDAAGKTTTTKSNV